MRSTSLLALVLLGACTKGPSIPQAVRSDSAGIEIVSNPGPDRPLGDSVTVTDTLVDGAVDTMLQGEARAVTVGADGQGRLVFNDGGFADAKVLRREADGTFHQIGRRGGGPGEYEMVGGISVAPSGDILVTDYSKQGFVHFAPDGSAQPVISWSSFGKGWSRGGGYYAGGFVFHRTDPRGTGGEEQAMKDDGSVDGPPPLQYLQFATATDTTVIAQLEEPRIRMVMFESCKVGFSQTPLYYPHMRWTGNAEMLAVTTGIEYRIDLWKGGKLFRSIRRDFVPRDVTKALAIQDMGPGMAISFGGSRPACTIDPNEIVEKQGFAPKLPAIRRMSMARDGTLWVERWSFRGEPMQRDIFDPTGNYLGTLTGDIAWPGAWLPNGQYVTVSANEDSLPVVARYAVGGATRQE